MQKTKPLSKEQQQLAEENIFLVERFIRLCYAKGIANPMKSDQFFNIGMDVEGAAYEALVYAARAFNPDYPNADFKKYLYRSLKNAIIREHYKNEKYVKVNYLKDSNFLRDLLEYYNIEINNPSGDNLGKLLDITQRDDEIIKAENELSFTQICERIEKSCNLRISAEDALLTMMHKKPLVRTASSYGCKLSTFRSSQNKVLNKIRKNKGLMHDVCAYLDIDREE